MVRIGRAIDNDIRLSGPLCSRHHCRIEVDAQGAWVIDLGSANGTQVDGKRIQRRALRPGDVIAIGGARIHAEDFAKKLERAGETQRIDEALAEGQTGLVHADG